jgi:hypothetical protein
MLHQPVNFFFGMGGGTGLLVLYGVRNLRFNITDALV